jgi:hypothetical protein
MVLDRLPCETAALAAAGGVVGEVAGGVGVGSGGL